MNLKTVAKKTGRAVSTVRADIHGGGLEATKLSNGYYDVSEAQLLDYQEYINNLSTARTMGLRARFERLSKKVFKVTGHVGGAKHDFVHAAPNTNAVLDMSYTQLDNGKYTDVFRVKSWRRGNILITTLYDSDDNVLLVKETTDGM